MDNSDEIRRINFDAPEAFYERLQNEKAARSLTIQQICIRAIERYLPTPEPVHEEIERLSAELGVEVREFSSKVWTDYLTELHNIKKLEKYLRPGPSDRTRATLERAASGVLQTLHTEKLGPAAELLALLNQFPIEKMQVLVESLQVDLPYYRSARMKKGEKER